MTQVLDKNDILRCDESVSCSIMRHIIYTIDAST